MHDSVNASQLYGIEIAKKVEVDGGSELTEEFLYSEIHPVRCLRQQHLIVISHNVNKNIPSSGEKPEQAQVCQTSRPKPRGKKVDKSSAQLTKSSNTENSQPKNIFKDISQCSCPKGQ